MKTPREEYIIKVLEIVNPDMKLMEELFRTGGGFAEKPDEEGKAHMAEYVAKVAAALPEQYGLEYNADRHCVRVFDNGDHIINIYWDETHDAQDDK